MTLSEPCGFFSCEAHPKCVNVKAASEADVCYPAHMFPQPSTHAQDKQGEGLVEAEPGQQGLFDQRSGPSGHWVLDCLRNGRELQRNKSPLYFTHMFLLHKNKLHQEGTKNKQQLWEEKQSEKDTEADVWKRLSE